MAASPSTARLVSALPNELPLLLIGGGLANLTLARVLAENSHGSSNYVRLFDQFPASSKAHYSLNLHQYAVGPLERAVKIPGLIDQATVDVSLGGRGKIESSVFDIETGDRLAPLDLPSGRTVRVNRAKVAEVLAGGSVQIEHGKKFQRWEMVRDKQGREAVKAVFDDGTEVVGCAIVGGDGVHSTVRAQLYPDCVPKVLPVVAYTGKWTNDSTVALQLDPKVNPIAYAHRKDNDTFRLDVADRSAFTYSFNKLDSVKMTLQWMYYRSPFSDGKYDPLWRPNRDLAGADSIPDALFDELAELAGKMKNDLKLFVGGLKKDEATGLKNWLMRTVSLPKAQSVVEGADRVIVIGDAAHGAPILAGESASHSILDGVLLARSLSKAFTTTGASSDPSFPISHPKPSTQGPVLEAIRAWETGQRDRWQASVEDAEARCLGLLMPLDVWRQGKEPVQQVEAPADK